MYNSLSSANLSDYGQRLKELLASRNSKSSYFLPSKTDPWSPIEAKKHPSCHESIQYIAKLLSYGKETVESAAIFTFSEETGNYHISSFPLQITGEDKGILHISDESLLARDILKCTHRLPIALCVGGDSIYSELASIGLPEWIDAFRATGFLRKKRIETVQCFTQEIKAPADCDFILEGYIQKSEEKVTEGRIFHVSCITHRLNASLPENPSYSDQERATVTELLSFPILKQISNDIEEIKILKYGNEIAVKVAALYNNSQAERIAALLWGNELFSGYEKIIILDSLCDLYNPSEIEHHIASAKISTFGETKQCINAIS